MSDRETETDTTQDQPVTDTETETMPEEFGGRKKGLEPTRYGDWEKNGRCIDF